MPGHVAREQRFISASREVLGNIGRLDASSVTRSGALHELSIRQAQDRDRGIPTSGAVPGGFFFPSPQQGPPTPAPGPRIPGIPDWIANFIEDLFGGGQNNMVPGGCREGFKMGSSGRCVPAAPFQPSGPDTGVVIGGLGAVAPFVDQTTRRVCPRNAVLGFDGLCHDKRTIRNSDRMYPRPRRPLLTGGDLNCIAKASRAARRIETQTKRLQKLGMLSKPHRHRKK